MVQLNIASCAQACAESLLRAERGAGGLLAEMEKNSGSRSQLRGDVPVGGYNLLPPTKDTTPTLADLGVTKGESHRWQMMAEMEKNKGAEGNPGGQGAKIVRLQDETTQTPTLSSLGVTKSESHRWQMMAEMEKNKGAKGVLPITGNKRVPVMDDSPTLSSLGVTKSESHRWQTIAGLLEACAESFGIERYQMP